MAEAPAGNHKLIWMGVGGAATFLLCLRMDAPVGMYIYTAVGVLVAAYWFWADKAPDKGERWDIAIAFPFLVMLWPVIALTLPFRKHFRDPQ